MQLKTFLRPALLASAVMVLLMVFAACATAAEPQIVEKQVIVEKEVIKEVPVEKQVVVEVEKEVVVEKEVPVEIERIKEVPVEVPVEVIVEKEVLVEREVVVVKEVLVNPPPLAMPGKGVEVQPARANWNTGYFQEALYSLALEELGYDVQGHQELDNAIFYLAVSQGDVDFWANAWFPLHTQFEETWSQGAEIAGTVIPAGGVQGYLVDKASVEKFGITTLADFAKPEVKEAFDHDGDGKADLYGCSDGWGCNKVIEHQIPAFELSDHINHNTASYNAMFADVKSRYENGDSVFYYTWAPNFTLSKAGGLIPGTDVIWVEVPSFAHPTVTEESELMASGLEGCVGDKDPCFVGFAANDIQVVANSKFLEENPAAAKLFEVMNLSVGDVSAQNNRMNAGENSQDDIDKHAKEWAAINADVWNSWLDQARRAAK